MGVKKKFLSQVETEASITPMMELLTEKKNKKDKRKKKLMSAYDAHLNDTADDDAFEVPKKKDKKNKKGTADHKMNSNDGEFGEAFEEKGKKKHKDKKHKESVSDDLDVNDNSHIMEPEGSPKKKKKKKKSGKDEDEEEMSQELDLNESSYSDSSPRKKKKKKRLDSESSFTLKSPKESKERNNPEIVQPSKKKRKQDNVEESENVMVSPKKKKVEESIKPGKSSENDIEGKGKENEGVNGSKIEVSDLDFDSVWSPEEEVYLITRIRDSLTSKDESVSYKKSISKINWDDIAFDNRSADDCKDALGKLIRKISKQKSLTMLLEEAENNCKGHKSIKVPRDRFLQLYFKKRKEAPDYNADKNKDIIREANLAWSNLPKEEKEVYEVEYKNEVKKHKKLMDLPPEHPRMPVAIYYDIQVKKLRTKSNELRRKLYKTFNEMEFQDKIPYVHESVKELFKYHKSLEEYQKSHPEWKETRKVRLCHSLLQEYLEYLSMPKYKSNSFSVFVHDMKIKGETDHIVGKDRLKHLTSMYQALSEEEKARYGKEAKRSQASYVENFNAWLEKQDEAVVLLVQKYYTPKAFSKMTFGRFSNVVEMTMSKPRFTEEPEKPPNAFKLFYLKFERRCRDKYQSKESMRSDCIAAWKVLPQKDKMVYEKRAKQNLGVYKEALIEYVRSLGHSSSVYLGFKRAEFFKFFKADIFEEEFPNENYPVFVSPKKKQKILTYDEDVSDKKTKKTNEDSDESSSESEANLHHSSAHRASSKSAGKMSKATASSEDDDSEEEGDEDEITQAWHAEKQSSSNKIIAGDSDDGESEEDDEEEEEDEDEDEDGDDLDDEDD